MTFASLKIDGVNRARSVHDYAAGKSSNVARVLHTLGENVLATGFLGGPRGEALRRDLDHVGIPHDFVEVASPTRLCITVIDESARTATELIEEPGPTTQADLVNLLAKLKAIAGQTDLTVMSGTITPGAAEDFYAQCIIPGQRVILDIVGGALLQCLPKRPLVIKLNQSEIGRTLGIEIGSESKLKDAMKELVSRGASWCVVTRGISSTLITDGGSFWEVNTPRVQTISPIGSGDAFAAGLAIGLRRGQEVPNACLLGAACGAANAMTYYAGHVRRDDVEELIKRISISQMT